MIVTTPNAINAKPSIKMRQSPGSIIAQTGFTDPANMKRSDKTTSAIPVIVSPFIFSLDEIKDIQEHIVIVTINIITF